MGDLEINYGPLLPSDPGARILDVGCGEGRLISFLMSHSYEYVDAVDSDEKAVARVRSVITERVEHIADLGEFLEERTASWDLIIARHVIYYFPRALTIPYLEALRKSLRDGGRIVVETFNGASLLGAYVAYKDYRINWILTEHSLRELLEEAGFSDVVIDGVRVAIKGLKGALYRLIFSAWRRLLAIIYVLERGRDEQNPTILTKSMLAYARAADA